MKKIYQKLALTGVLAALLLSAGCGGAKETSADETAWNVPAVAEQKTVAAYYFYRDCSDPYHIFLSDAHSFGKTFWLTQWNRHSVFCRCDR